MDKGDNGLTIGGFAFDEWAALARDDPAEFEQRRRTVVRSAIDSAPAHLHQRLEGLQFRLDLERSRSSTALGACVRLNSLMWAGFHRLRRELNAATHPGGTREPGEPPIEARIIPFARRPLRRWDTSS